MADKSAREGSSNRFVFDEMPSKTCENTGQGNVYLAEMDRDNAFLGDLGSRSPCS